MGSQTRCQATAKLEATILHGVLRGTSPAIPTGRGRAGRETFYRETSEQRRRSINQRETVCHTGIRGRGECRVAQTTVEARNTPASCVAVGLSPPNGYSRNSEINRRWSTLSAT